MANNLINEEFYDFLNKNFPKCANDLKEGIELLENILQSTIDTIEEKSGEIIKKERDFSKADDYRKKESILNVVALKLQEVMDNLSIETEPEDNLTIEEKEEKEIPNYNEYLVDSNVQHTLYEDFTHKRPIAFELNGEKYNVRDWKDMLLQTCNIISIIDKDLIMNFPQNERMNGKKVTYFAYKEDDIVRAPRKLENLDLYVSTNHSANSIRNIITNILREYKISVSAFKIYLRADYSELH
ncbi:hypothetical protein FDA33_05305 [Clostridium botulinum]|nr:hypothetical protein [Clostridium botulinum]NFI16833.1 hypothetical protein [Clostridium botulinum]NFI54595.1 hypothetical protein [Clostridium botulinum]NFL91547.1 hypothetical protein [Clostridium botulinum]NFN51464.1 hypothetical protein [Clostridium botulinum]